MGPHSYLQPASINYTPGWTLVSGNSNVNIGNGTLTSSYVQLGSIVTYSMDFTFGTGSTPGGGGYYVWTLPKAAKDNYRYVGSAFLLDNGTAFDAGNVVTVSATLVAIAASVGNGNFVNSAYPYTFTSGDRISFTITYEAQ